MLIKNKHQNIYFIIYLTFLKLKKKNGINYIIIIITSLTYIHLRKHGISFLSMKIYIHFITEFLSL